MKDREEMRRRGGALCGRGASIVVAEQTAKSRKMAALKGIPAHGRRLSRTAKRTSAVAAEPEARAVRGVSEAADVLGDIDGAGDVHRERLALRVHGHVLEPVALRVREKLFLETVRVLDNKPLV